MKVLITGVAGHLGSRLAQFLIDTSPNIEIFGIDDLSGGYKENVPEEVSWVNVELGQDYRLQGLTDLDYVFHLAAYAAEGRSPFIRHFNYRSNVLATAQIVNHCINTGVKRLVYTSSMAVYGRSDGNLPFDEHSPCTPIDPYGVAKLACEMDIRIAGEQHGLDYCIIRPHNVFGPYQCIWQDYRNVLGIWMRQYLTGKPFRIYGSGEQTRAFSYIDDVIPCLWKAATEPYASKQTINLGGAMPYSMNEAASLLEKVIGEKHDRHYTEMRHEVHHAYSTTEKSEKVLGYATHTDFKLGLSKMWDWAKTAWKEHSYRAEITDSKVTEVEKGLYSFWK